MESFGLGSFLKRLHQEDNNDVTALPTKRPKLEKEPFKYSSGLEKNKLFVRSVDYACSEDELKNLFDIYGEVKSVRIITKKNGAPKGFAYVEFNKEEEAEKALAANDKKLCGRKIKVYLSNPPPKDELEAKEKAVKKTEDEAQCLKDALLGQIQPTAERGKCTLFVRNVDRACTEKELKELFAKHGRVESVRIVMRKSGQKTVAFVNMSSPEEARTALGLNNYKLYDRQINVDVSNPPAEKENEKKRKPSAEIRPTVHVAKAGRLMLPRSLFKKSDSR